MANGLRVSLYIGLGMVLGSCLVIWVVVIRGNPEPLLLGEQVAEWLGVAPFEAQMHVPRATPVRTLLPPTATPTQAVPLSFTAICDGGATMSGLLQKNFIQSVTQTQVVDWTGTISAISLDQDTYKLHLNMREGSNKARQLEIWGVSQALASQLVVGQAVRFTGTIQEIRVAYSLICNPLIIVNATITLL